MDTDEVVTFFSKNRKQALFTFSSANMNLLTIERVATKATLNHWTYTEPRRDFRGTTIACARAKDNKEIYSAVSLVPSFFLLRGKK
jgi:hypothetical protein